MQVAVCEGQRDFALHILVELTAAGLYVLQRAGPARAIAGLRRQITRSEKLSAAFIF